VKARGTVCRDRRQLPPAALTIGGATLACLAALCSSVLWTHFYRSSVDQTQPAAIRGDRLDLVARRGDRLDLLKGATPSGAAVRSDKLAASKPGSFAKIANSSLFDPRLSLGAPPGGFTQDTHEKSPVASSSQSVRTASADRPAPAPKSRNHQTVQSAASPAHLRLPSKSASDGVRGDVASWQSPKSARDKQPTFLTKLIDFFNPIRRALAYAPDDDGLRQRIAGRFDPRTAVYDISAHVVYMPDGTRLEAHSGYGSKLDDPDSAAAKDRGVTPPDVYELKLRKRLFHGVRALRLIPEDERKVFGRSGFLAHSFMLGPNGDSNGCVSFRNYDAFLKAFLEQKVKRLAVVTRL
jgi:Tlde1 domain